MPLKVDYSMFWKQLGLSIPPADMMGAIDRRKATVMHNLVARYLFEHPDIYAKRVEEDRQWKWFLSNHKFEDGVPYPTTKYGYYEVLKMACAEGGVDYENIPEKLPDYD